jgi:hypothetical protein
MTHPNQPKPQDVPAPLDDTRRLAPGEVARLEITIDWDWDPVAKEVLDNRTGLPLLDKDGNPNEAILDAPDRPGWMPKQ